MKKKSTEQLIDEYDYLANAASAQDCTGLIPSLPQNEAELESYNDVVQYRPPLTQIKNSVDKTAPGKKD